MKTLISGHRFHKLQTYDTAWIKEAIELSLCSLDQMAVGLSGMASGVDLWFCEACLRHNKPYIACPPFDGQEATMAEHEALLRRNLLSKASKIWRIKNSTMVKEADMGILVFDGNKGGTHNVFQQMVENKKPFMWINPVGEKIWECF